MRGGFGLTELLVVIGLLAVICLGAISGVGWLRGRGQQVTCLSNLRQIHAAAIAYAADHRGYFPKSHFLDEEGNANWIDALQNGDYTTPIDSRQPRKSIHFCPALNKPPSLGRHSPNTVNYGANRSILGYFDQRPGGRNDPSTPLQRIGNPSAKLLFFDYGGTYAFWLNISKFSAPNYIPGHHRNAGLSWSDTYRRDAVEGRHGHTINVIHVDGSAITVAPETFLNIPAAAWAP